MRLLVVEDDKDLNRQLVQALGQAGYAVDRAFDGEEGLFLGETEPYDAVVLDIGLPKKDGVAVLEAWRKSGRTMPVLILTARDTWSEKVRGFDAGADDYVTKPFGSRELSSRVRAVLRRAEAEDWQPGEEEADWRAYAAFRRAEALLLLARPDEGLSALEAVATDMEGDLLGELARAFLQGYGSGEDPDAAARGVAAMQGADLYAHFYYERGGALRFPMEASGILYLGAGMVAYLNAHPDLAGDLPALRAGLAEIGFQVGGVLADENGDLSIIVPLPNRSYAYGQDSWVLAVDGDRWHVSLPVSEGEWPVVGWFAP